MTRREVYLMFSILFIILGKVSDGALSMAVAGTMGLLFGLVALFTREDERR
ncbi:MULTISPECIES: hypothetical protein [unclassified Aeromicrobium]|uniref:hypothetical protein n=1 Tax=unclassified Aeromicrobium TaxID=2633570 RepID=UPI00288BF680|nr:MULTISPECIES: hypothetical protein [unclassified Aeromicrobium]